jgi:hypothetical protein
MTSLALSLPEGKGATLRSDRPKTLTCGERPDSGKMLNVSKIEQFDATAEGSIACRAQNWPCRGTKDLSYYSLEYAGRATALVCPELGLWRVPGSIYRRLRRVSIE